MTLDFGALFRRSFDPNDDAAALAVHRFFGGLIESLVAIIYCADVVPTLRKNLKNFLHPRQLQYIQDHNGGGGDGGGSGGGEGGEGGDGGGGEGGGDGDVFAATDDVIESDDDESPRGSKRPLEATLSIQNKKRREETNLLIRLQSVIVETKGIGPLKERLSELSIVKTNIELRSMLEERVFRYEFAHILKDTDKSALMNAILGEIMIPTDEQN